MGLNIPFFCGFRYLFDEVVNGVAYVVFGIVQNGQKNSFPSSLQRVQVSTHLAFFVFCMTLTCKMSRILCYSDINSYIVTFISTDIIYVCAE